MPCGGIKSHFNKTTGQWEGVIYDTTEIKKKIEEEAAQRNALNEEAKKKYLQDKHNKQMETERIKTKLKLDKLEREANRRLQQQQQQQYQVKRVK